MGLFRKKQHHRTAVDETTDSSYQDEDESSKSRRSSGMGKWVCGSNSSKHVLEQDNKISPKNSYSSSTASSQEDKRDDKQGFNVTNTRSASASPRDMDYEDLDNSLISCLPPPAAQAAFDGPPRFDWIDVEYHAATRVQKIFRRHLVLQEMEHAGMTTSYIRNRKRERKAKSSFFPTRADEASPDFGFACCSMNLAFGDGDFDPEDMIAYKDFQRKQYEEKTKAQKEREEFLSQSYLAQKGIHSKVEELDQTKFREENLMGLYHI